MPDIKKLFINKPSVLLYFVTNRCNASCVMCHRYKDLNKEKSNELNISEVRSICHKLKKLTLLQCSGGEPFVREDIGELLQIFASISRSLAIPTNGFLPEKVEQTVLKLVKNNKNSLFKVALSLDGLEELHDTIRNYKGGFNLLMETYNRLKPINAKYKNMLLTFNTVLTKMNENRMEDIIKFVSNLAVDEHVISNMWGETENKGSLKVSLESYKKALQIRYSAAYSLKKTNTCATILRFVNKLADIHMINYMQGKRNPYSCKAIKKFILMMPNGDIRACHKMATPLGNVRDNNYDINEILQNKESRKTIETINSKKCTCDILCCQKYNILYDKKAILFFLRYISQFVKWHI